MLQEICLLCIIALFVQIGGNRIHIETRNLPFRNDIVLYCRDDQDMNLATMNLELRRTIADNETVVFSNFTVSGPGEMKFTITPFTEGNFSCVDLDTNTVSTNSIPIVAVPTLDPDFVFPNTNLIPLGSTVDLRCSFGRGVLIEYYNVQWHRGTETLNETSDPRYEVSQSNLTLTIHNVNLYDASDSYYCHLSVLDPILDQVFSASGYDVDLVVYGALDLFPATLYDTVVKEGTPDVVFTCSIASAPAGIIRWLINGTDVPTNDRFTTQSKQVNSSVSASTVASNLSITNPQPSDSGLVQCVGYVDNGINTMIRSNEATLTVIGNNFSPSFVTTPSGDVMMSIAFEGVILEVFTLHIRFISSADDQITHNTILSDPSFYNTALVDDFVINKEHLPTTFYSFTVAVAVEVMGVVGDYTTPSNTIVLPNPSTVNTAPPTSTMTSSAKSPVTVTTTSTTTTPSTVGGASTNLQQQPCGCKECVSSSVPLVAIIVVLVVLLLVTLVVSVCVCAYCQVSKQRLQRSAKNGNQMELNITNPNYTKNTPTSRTESSVSESSCSRTHTSPTTTGEGDSHSYCSVADNRSHTYTPSRPSSQESYYVDRSRTVSPLGHIYENDELMEKEKKKQLLLQEQQRSTDEREKSRTMSSIAVGTSPPRNGKEIVIPAFIKGQSESPKRAEERLADGVISPARSDPSLESSLKSSSDHSNTKGFTKSLAIPGSSQTRDEHSVALSPAERTLPTYQQFKYGSNKPPVVAPPVEEPKKEDEKIYQKIITEYDVV